MSEPPRGARRRLGLVAADQVVSSASNFLVTILAARALGVASFGLFSLVFLTYVAAQGAGRALTGEPLLVHPEEAAARVRDVVGSAIGVGAAFGGLVAAVGVVLWATVGTSAGPALVVLGGCLPMLFVQDVGRYLGFALHRPRRSIALDLTWLVLVVVAVAALMAAHREGLVAFVACWAGTGAVTGLVTLVQHRVGVPRPGLAWLRTTWPFSWRYALSFASMQGAALGVSVALLGVADARALAAVRGAWLLLGPYVQLQAAAIAAGVAEVSRMDDPARTAPAHVRRTTSLTVGVAALNGLVLIVLPDSLGRLVLGPTWDVTRELVVPAALQMVLMGSISGVRSALLGVRAVRTTMAVDVSTTALTFAATLVGAAVDGAYGAFSFLAGAQAVAAVVWWVTYLRHDLVAVRRPMRTSSPADGSTVDASTADPAGGDPAVQPST